MTLHPLVPPELSNEGPGGRVGEKEEDTEIAAMFWAETAAMVIVHAPTLPEP